MKKLFFTCFLFFSIPSMAQVNVDSLWAVWNDPTQHDTIRLKAMNKMVWGGYLFSQTDSALFYTQHYFRFAEEKGLKLQMSDALNTYGVALTIKGEFDSALYFYQRSLAISEEIGNNKRISSSLNNIAIVYHNLGDLYKSIDFLSSSLAINDRLNNRSAVGGILNNIAGLYDDLGEHTTAMNYHRRSLNLAKDADDKRAIQAVLSNIGRSYLYHQKNYDSALHFYHKALSISEEIGDKSAKILIGNSIGVTYKNLGNYSKAIQHLTQSLALAKELGSKLREGSSLGSLAQTYKLQGDSAHLSGNIIYSEEKYRQSLANGLRALTIGKEIKDTDILKNATDLLSSLYEAKGLYRQSLDMFRLYISTRDSVISEKNQKEVIRQQYKYDYEKQKLSDDVAHGKELEKEATQRNTLYIILIILAMFVIFIYRAWKIRKGLSEKIETSYAKLKELNAYKESMTAMINHDLRSPLTLINGYISRILDNDQNYLTSETEEDLSHLKRNSDKLMEMSVEIQELLLLKEGRLNLNISEVEMNQYLKVLVNMFSSVASESSISLTFTSHVSEDLPIRLDHKHFDKIVYNLLTNAIRYTEKEGSINVLLDRTDTHCEIIFEDTGQGISAKHLPLVFDRFYQSADNQYKSQEGYGIGLAVVKELVELHGGEVSIASELDKGTSIRVLLPFNLDKKIQKQLDSSKEKDVSKLESLFKEAPNSMVGQDESSVQQTVLIVDDQEDIRTYISDIIRSDYHVIHAANGNQALKVMGKETVDLIITDLMMPWLDGFGLIEKIKQNDQFRSIPILVISARTTEEDKLKVLDQGVNNFMSKPFNPAELKKRIHNLLTTTEGQRDSWDHIIGDKDLLSNVEQNILKKLNQIIIDHIDDSSLTIDLVAFELSASRSKAIKMIKNLTDKTPLAYIKGIRMDYVSTLIGNKKVKNTTEAAQAIGMKNATQFSQQYQKHFGKSPF